MKWLLFFTTTLVGLGASCGGLIAEPTPTPPDDAPMCHRAHDLQAGEPPACPPRGIEFTNTTDDPAYIAGTVTVRHVIDESDLTDYKVYFGTSPTEKVGTRVKQLDAKGIDVSFTFNDNVKVPAGVGYLIAVSCNANGETGFVSVPIGGVDAGTRKDGGICHSSHDIDGPPVCPPLGIEFTNTSNDPTLMAGTVTVRHVIDEADIICYKVYWGKSPTESVGTWLKDLQANGTDPSFTWTVSDQVKRPAGVDYLLAVSCNSNGETGYAAVKL